MNYIRKYRIVSLYAIVILMAACEDIMDLNLSGDSTPSLVVEGTITSEKLPHKVKLSYTSDYFTPSDEVMVGDARVSITDGVDTFLLREEGTGYYYTSDTVYGEPGKTYTLSITLADGRQYSASDYMNSCPEFDSICQTGNYNSYSSGYGYNVLFYGKEPETPGDHYLFLLYKDHKLYSDTITEVFFTDDASINGMHVKDYPVYRIREADLHEGMNWVTLEMHSITSGYYDFLMALMSETVWRGSPWDGPPANVPGNISNGAKGYFRASNVKYKSKMFFPTPRLN